MAPGLIPPSLITASALVGAMFLLSGRDATGLAPGPTFDELPASGTLTREAPVMVFELDGPTFLAVYDPLVISDDGCSGTRTRTAPVRRRTTPSRHLSRFRSGTTCGG